MMRVPGFISTAVRNPEGNIITNREEFVSKIQKNKKLDFPIIRGAIHLFEAMKMGFRTLQWSADIAFPEEAKSQNKFLEFLMTIISILFSIIVFRYV